jgi:hypothetical protein
VIGLGLFAAVVRFFDQEELYLISASAAYLSRVSGFACLRLAVFALLYCLTWSRCRHRSGAGERSIDLKCFGNEAGPSRRADGPVGTPSSQMSSIRLNTPARMVGEEVK